MVLAIGITHLGSVIGIKFTNLAAVSMAGSETGHLYRGTVR